MISANELRIGNRLYRNGIIVTIDARSILDICDNSEEYSPVPISEDILLKAGFEFSEFDEPLYEGEKNGYYYKSVIPHGGDMYTKIDFLEGDKTCCTDVFLLYNDKVRATYVHQLQNLYFCLIGKELNIHQ